MNFARILCAAGVSLVAVTGVVSGQTVNPKTEIRFIADGGAVLGRVESSDETSVQLMVGGQPRSFRRNEMSEVFRRTSNAGKGAQIGAFAGTIVGALMMGAIAGGYCEKAAGCAGDAMIGAAIGGVLGLAGGAATGALIGSLTHRWVPAPDISVRNSQFNQGAAFSPRR
jgi:hypothetical protein